MSLVVGEEFEGECKETCWNEILEKTKKIKKKMFHTPVNGLKKVSYPSHFVVTFFVLLLIPRRLSIGILMVLVIHEINNTK